MRLIIFVLVFFLQSNFCWAWDEASARQEAFRKVQHKIDISLYPNRDPYYQENLKAIKEGRNRVSNRFITVEDFGYVVSELNENGKQKITMFYDRHATILRHCA